MTALDLVTDLRRRGVALRTRDGRLQGSAPRGILTPEDRAALVAHKDEIIALLRREEEDTLIAEAVEISGARIIAELPAGACPACHPHRDTAAKADTIFGDALRCGRCRGQQWRPAPGRPGEVICTRCWSADGTTLRPYEQIVPPAPCPVCSGPAWRVCGVWRCERCEPPGSNPGGSYNSPPGLGSIVVRRPVSCPRTSFSTPSRTV